MTRLLYRLDSSFEPDFTIRAPRLAMTQLAQSRLVRMVRNKGEALA
jgi:hypothetical protein